MLSPPYLRAGYCARAEPIRGRRWRGVADKSVRAPSKPAVQSIEVNKVYPEEINRRSKAPRNAGDDPGANAEGRAASLLCGTRVQFQLFIKSDSKLIESAKFRSNGCGFMIAAADVMVEKIGSMKLTDLHGTDIPEFQKIIEDELGEFPADREHCLLTVIDSLRDAFADFRARQIEEFTGEKALMCTCFGVTEETIEKVIEQSGATTVVEVGELCNAGTGCGSCQMMIAEMIGAETRQDF